jgi:hypothetical protein
VIGLGKLSASTTAQSANYQEKNYCLTLVTVKNRMEQLISVLKNAQWRTTCSLICKALFCRSNPKENNCMPDCIQCGAYTKYPGGKCFNCYKKSPESKTNTLTAEWDQGEEKGGLNDREWQYRYSMIKGRIAETLIQELFLSLDYNVFRYGMENTIPGIMELLKGVKSDVAKQIRRMPDFVIQHPQTKEVFFIEVKFRANGCFNLKDLPDDYPYDNAFIVLVSKKHIKCISVGELRAGKEITLESRNYLGSRKEFELDKEVIVDFCDFALRFFETV